MKKEIADYIEIFLAEEKPLTDTQVRKIAYWEFVDFQCGVNEPGIKYGIVINKLLRGVK